MVKQLHTSALIERDLQSTDAGSLGAQLSEIGVLDSDAVSVDKLSSAAADVRLEGLFRPPVFDPPEMDATELEELAESALTTLPLFRPDGTYPKSGWYEIDSADVSPLHPNAENIWRYDVDLTKVGTNGSHFRVVETSPRDVEHDFGSEETAEIALPASARKVRWIDLGSRETAVATAETSRQTNAGEVDIYDIGAGETALDVADGDSVGLVYAIDYAADAQTPRVYDTRGNNSSIGDRDAKFDIDGVRRWQLVHATDHDVDDALALSSRALRILVSEPDTSATGGIVAFEYDDEDGYQEVSLPDTGWLPLDLDVVEIRQHRIRAQLLLQESGGAGAFSSNGGDLYAVEIVLEHGMDEALVYRPPGVDEPMPNGVHDLFDPIASSSTVDVGARRELLARNDVRK